MKSWSEIYLRYLSALEEKELPLPEGFRAMNPYSNEEVWKVVEAFYRKFYSDSSQRTLIFGINPGRLGAGATGIPFTDTKHLLTDCGIQAPPFSTHEPSSVFVYEVIRAFGGVDHFYKHFLISSLSPLGFITDGKKGGSVNVNYYDDQELLQSTEQFIRDNLLWHSSRNVNRKKAFCLGTGKNFNQFERLNKELKLFEELVPLEHPRFVMQYRFKFKDDYVRKYIETLLPENGNFDFFKN